MRRLSKQQLIVLAILVVWVLLLGIGLIGSSVVGAPHALTATAGAIALIALFWWMPGMYLYALILERQRGTLRARGISALAIRWRWYFLFSGALAVLAGFSLLISSTHLTPEIRLGGAIILVWGLLALSVAVLAFRTKPWLADPQRTR